jgi:hypothetical protein
MYKSLSGFLTGAGLMLLISANDNFWLVMIGLVIFLGSLMFTISLEITESKEETKREILDEVEEMFEERNL